MLDRISASLPSLAPAEQRVGKLVLEDPHRFARLPVRELAERAHVSKPTVVRFCRSMGYDGLADFKLKLAGNVAEGVPFVHRSVDVDDKTSDVLVKVIDNSVAAFLQYRNAANPAAIEQAVNAITSTWQRKQRLEIYGVGNSGVVAQDAQHKFFRLGISSQATSDTHIQTMGATMLRPGDCLIVISNSGRTRELVDVAHIARHQGATVIAITSSHTPLSDSSHILLAADNLEGSDLYSPMASRLLHLLIIDILATAVALKMGDGLAHNLQNLQNQLQQKRYGI
ncbi:MurR/RpiR family transcriptional regulator [Comamonas aquatica]|jgi:RpiR family carbohydrate utilization transcriptional regulator|uniref:MurR/RpiR family transcriptional regulator n=1 Tax=Comamonas aquatica TaxID=225991 RepID=A0AA42W3I1_9BURK|nr:MULTISPECIES: MurR/RpiR family transcriptional regulator [Comamonas]MDE1555549.1 MurR/RpiR family transcriptional regulator [Comamonas aquatica]MDH0363009.1 MurR/RpiR family transcriptional regulator [Comamonas aquatica]MDH0370321.1 MurR/RpiR family transcriptional regulator [Comamonas aquatica]MDH0493999.1 MurR/RpiR family transcriptional regulator [Comamonas aquatica]MDH0899801.1 MurR/RpiR family transcriptional regulator [Comamonas aquatica]